eukprot:scaffold102792_cov25-Tisochrysis_lutea.AAC.3
MGGHFPKRWQGLLRPEALWPKGYRAVRAIRAEQAEPITASATLPAAGTAPAVKRQKSNSGKKSSSAAPATASENETITETLTILAASSEGAGDFDGQVRTPDAAWAQHYHCPLLYTIFESESHFFVRALVTGVLCPTTSFNLVLSFFPLAFAR